MLRSIDASTPSGAMAWQRASAFLWKVQRGRQARWSLRRRDDDDDTNFTARGGDLYEYNAPESGTLVQHLLPQTLRLVPIGLIILLMVVFVFVVGPGDYLLLGLVRRRKYTWVLFPVLSVAFALFMVFLSEHYMGSTDERHAMVFVDVGAGGRVLRANRYELIFSAGSGTAETELAGCFFAPTPTTGDMYYTNEEREPGEVVPLYSGRVPTHYTVRQEIRKWSPQLNRVFSLDPLEVAADVEIRFDAVNVAMLKSAVREGEREYEPGAFGARGRLREALVGSGDFHGDIHVIRGSTLATIHRGLPRREYREDRMGPYRESGSMDAPAEFVHSVSVRKPGGVFSVFSQVSPTAGPGFDDLAVLDRTADDEYLLIVITRVGDDTMVYRCLYCGEE